MAYSMTGFGRGMIESDSRKITVEIKAVNHRYLELFIRMPREYAEFEDVARRLVAMLVNRGKLELSVVVENVVEGEKIVHINESLLSDYVSSCDKIAEKFALQKNNLDLVRLLTLPEVVKVKNCEADKSSFEEELSAAITAATSELQKMRHKEGIKLIEDIASRVKSINDLVVLAKESSTEMIEEYRLRLQNKLKKLLPDGLAVDENRLAMELVLFADKCDITEEAVRLESHSSQLINLLQESGPIGRKLDFILQEMNREVNTIGSKANNTSVAKVMVEAKTELEKMREQAQNIE